MEIQSAGFRLSLAMDNRLFVLTENHLIQIGFWNDPVNKEQTEVVVVGVLALSLVARGYQSRVIRFPSRMVRDWVVDCGR